MKKYLKTDEWNIIEDQFHPDRQRMSESSIQSSETDVSGNGGILRSLTAVTVTVVHLWPASLSWTKPA